jgi:hypothetical protein
MAKSLMLRTFALVPGRLTRGDSSTNARVVVDPGTR